MGRTRRWEELLRRALYEDVFWGGAILLGDREKQELMPRDAGRWSSWSVLRGFYDEIDGRWPDADTVQRMTYIELRQRLPELLLPRVDKITMSVSLEARVPFLDYRLVEYVLRLPERFKIGDGSAPRRILKHAVADLLPDDLIHRRKQGFPAPMSQWVLEEEFGRFVRDTLRTSALVDDGVLDGACGRAHRRGALLAAPRPRGAALDALQPDPLVPPLDPGRGGDRLRPRAAASGGARGVEHVVLPVEQHGDQPDLVEGLHALVRVEGALPERAHERLDGARLEQVGGAGAGEQVPEVRPERVPQERLEVDGEALLGPVQHVRGQVAGRAPASGAASGPRRRTSRTRAPGQSSSNSAWST